MKFSAAVVLAAATGALAAPSHGHRHAHRSVEAREFVMAKKPAPPAPAPETTTPPPPPPPATTSTPEPAPETKAPVAAAAAVVDTSSSSSSSSSSSPASTPSSSGGAKPFCHNVKRATLAQIAYAGNTGGTGSDFGCNMQEIDAGSASSYDYTAKFVNKGSDELECKVWNKMGRTLQINGFFSGNEVLTFKVAVGGEQYVAFEANSQIGAACGSGSVTTTPFGQFANTWLEADFANESNGGSSGYDASALVPGKYGLPINAMKVCGSDGTCSSIYAGGGGDNAYLPGMEADDGVGGNVVPGPLHLTVSVNGL